MIITMLMKQFGKSVLADCDVVRCIQLRRKEWHVKHARYAETVVICLLEELLVRKLLLDST